MTFEGYICWEEADVQKIAPIDVAGLAHEADSDSSIFLATHQSLPLLRLADATSGRGAPIDEEELLMEFSSPLVGNDPQIMIITGSVGSGKSHMVKWLHAGCANQAHWHQVYIKKRNTNLRRVVETILAGLSGPRVSELRDKLEVARSSINNLDEAKHQILHVLSHHIEFPPGGIDSVGDARAESRKQLPQILNDPVLSQHLLQEGGAVHRITKLGLTGLQLDNEDEHDLFFREGDLPLSPENINEASRPAQNAIRMLSASSKLRSASIEVLNEALSSAKAAVFLGTGIDLSGVFDEVRVELGKRGLELVLYIEDFVLLQGIDRELAQVFTEAKDEAGDRCGMRVVIAVTQGFLASGFDTLTSRARHFSLDLRLGHEVSRAEARTFVGRYLNAIRLGPSRLSRERKNMVPGSGVPNRCDACEFTEECHGAFGADGNRYGFYPLNEAAVDKLVELAGPSQADEKRFDPREVLRHVVRDPLARAVAELPSGRFPSSQFAASLDQTRRSVDTKVRTDLEGSADGERRITLLGFWVGGRVTEVVNLDPAVHKAFKLPEFQGATRTAGPAAPADVPARADTEHPQLGEIEAWANDAKILSSTVARTVRRIIFDAVVEELQSRASGLRVIGGGRRVSVGGIRFEENSIRIEAAAGGGGGQLRRAFEINIERSAKMAVLLKAMMTASRMSQWPPSSIQQYVDLVVLVEKWASELSTMAGKGSIDLEPAVRLLALTSQPDIGVAKSPGGCLELMLQHRVHSDPSQTNWQAWSKQAISGREKSLGVLNRCLTAAKGTGASSIVDSAPILKQLDRASSVRQVGDKIADSDDFGKELVDLRDCQARTTQRIWADVERLLGLLAEHVDENQTWKEIEEGVGGMVEAAHNALILPVADLKAQLSELAALVPDDAVTTFTRLSHRARIENRQLWDLVPDPIRPLQALLDYCDAVGDLLAFLEDRLGADARMPDVAASPGSAAVALKGLANALDDLVGGGEM